MRTVEPTGERDPAQLEELRDSLERRRGAFRRDPVHAPGKRRIGRVPDADEPHRATLAPRRHQPWVPTSGLVGRKRRSARRS